MTPKNEATPEAANFTGHATNEIDRLITQSEGIANSHSRPGYVNPFPHLTSGTSEHGKAVVAAEKKAYWESMRAKEKESEAEEPPSDWRDGLTELKRESEEVMARALGKKLVSAIDLAETPLDPEQTLLGERWLCRGGAALMVAPSGVGKSSASMQMDLCWAVGREAFGIKPARPLRILTIQAENDPGDMHEMVTGVMRGMGFSLEEEAMIRENCQCYFEQNKTGADFVQNVVEPLLQFGKFDLLRIDPLSAYAGADMTQADKSAALLRNSLNPLLTKHGVGLLLVHHTPKPVGRDTSKIKPGDITYAGAGSADIVNWARASLIIENTGVRKLFVFHAGKRGDRIGWFDGKGDREFNRWFKHSDHGIFWEEAEADLGALKAGKKSIEVDAETIMGLVPRKSESIEKKLLLAKAQDSSVGDKRARAAIDDLVKQGRLLEEKEPRDAGRPKEILRRTDDGPFLRSHSTARGGIEVSFQQEAA